MKSIIKVGKKRIGDGFGCFIIAEAGSNHNGKLENAYKLIDVAASCGADAVKFQTFKAEKIYSKKAGTANYLKTKKTIFDIIKSMEMPEAWIPKLYDYCRKKNIMFLSTPFDHDSIELLSDLGLEIFKIPSGELTNLPYLRHIGKLNKKVILSTGMADMGEIEDALDILISAGMKKENITSNSILIQRSNLPSGIYGYNIREMQGGKIAAMGKLVIE